MMTFLRKFQLHIFSVIIFFFLAYIVLGFGSSFFGRSGSLNEPVAEVGREKIPVRLFYGHYQRALNQVKAGTALDENIRRQKRDETIRDLVQSVVFAKEARAYGIEV